MIEFNAYDDIYESKTIVIVGDNKEARKRILSVENIGKEDLENKDGGVFKGMIDGVFTVMIWLSKEKLSNGKRAKKASLISHEAFHATEEILFSHGVSMRVDEGGNEHFAYYLGWMVEFITQELINLKLY